MKYIVTSYMRVGSTLVTEVLSKLTGEPWTYVELEHFDGTKLSEDNIEKIQQATGVVKLHNATAGDIIRSIKDVTVVLVKRNFLDTLASRILYERYNRYEQNEDTVKSVQNLLKLYPAITDAALCNLYVETQEKEIKEEYALWMKYCHTVVSSRVIVANYDNFIKRPSVLLASLTCVQASKEKQKEALSCFNHAYIKEKHGNTFMSFGASGQGRILFDQTSLKRLDQIIKTLKYTQ